LQIANSRSGATKIDIMLKASVPHNLLLEYFSAMINEGLLECNKLDHKYRTTDKGRKLLLERILLPADA
jgi:predicted transcriptional regulator